MKHHHFKTLTSTNDWAKEHMSSFKQTELTIISADVQTKARGQYSRSWLSQKGNLYVSFCFFENQETCTPIALTQAMANLLLKFIQEYGLHCTIKIPNDLMIKGKKIAGILCETVAFDHLTGVIIGVGLNINMDSATLDQISQPATSLKNELGKTFEIEPILDSIAKRFQDRLSHFD